MNFTYEDYTSALERLFKPSGTPPPAPPLYISSDMLKAVVQGELDGATLLFSNGCVFKGKTLRMLLVDAAAIKK